MTAIKDLDILVRAMQPALNPGCYVYALNTNGNPIDAASIVASIQEPEGQSVIVEESRAKALGLQSRLRCAWITLRVQSDLEAVGLTAAFATALAQAGISCNVVAGLHHDHIFVPQPLAAQAMTVLQALQTGPGRDATTIPMSHPPTHAP